MDRYVIVKIGRPTDAAFAEWKRLEGMAKTDTGQVQTGKPFLGEITVHVAANAYTLGIVQTILRAACVNYSLHTGKEVRRRNKKCGTSTASEARQAALTLDIQDDQTLDLDSTTAEECSQREGTDGNTNG